MGFDRGDRRWRIEVSDTQAYRQFGNAVVVPVVEFIAKAMQSHLRKALDADTPIRKLGDIPLIAPPSRECMVAGG
jgi:DNA (cytosine-5)-methyltransferase 1